jgi:hypothetical protein
MNIAAYMVACNADLDATAKSALRAVAGRANRSGFCWASISRIAEDMGCCYKTAQRALGRAVEAGYLTVDNPCGKAAIRKLTSVTESHDLGNSVPYLGTLGADDGYMDKNDGEAGTSAHGENHTENRHGRGCECRGTGWVEIEDPVVGGLMVARCPAKLTIVDG